jgi:FkbM family methyltransferase
MNTIFETTKEYRTEFINVLKQNKSHYNTELAEYTTPSKNHNIKYHKWKHPYQGNWEYEEIFTDGILGFLKDSLNSNSVVLDIGAQVGLMSVGFAQFSKKVIAFEPNPATFEVLEKNSEIYKNIQPYNLACSTEETVLEFHYSDDGFCNGGFALGCDKGIGVTGHNIPMDVYAVNLLNFMNTYHKDDIKNISLIKVDAEGHDKEILKTIYPVLKEVKPLLITEMYAGLTQSEAIDLINTIKNISYDIYDIGNKNEGLSAVSQRKKINTINDVNLGNHGNFLCIPN